MLPVTRTVPDNTRGTSILLENHETTCKVRIANDWRTDTAIVQQFAWRATKNWAWKRKLTFQALFPSM